MNKKIILIIGLPGSGKTYYASSKIDNSSYLIDDIKSVNILTDALLLDNVKNIYITDPLLCIPQNFLNCLHFLSSRCNVSIEKVFFENDIKKAWNNVQKRNDGRIISLDFIQYLSRNYNPPTGSMKIFSI